MTPEEKALKIMDPESCGILGIRPDIADIFRTQIAFELRKVTEAYEIMQAKSGQDYQAKWDLIKRCEYLETQLAVGVEALEKIMDIGDSTFGIAKQAIEKIKGGTNE